MQTEDRQIIHQCLNGDTAMFGFLVDKYREGVYALAYSRLGNFHDAQDIAQEAFIKAYRKLHTLRHWDNFALWLSAITSNLCKNFIRSKSKRPDREFADDQSQEIIDHISVDSYRESLADESLKEALNSLPVIYRQVLVLHYLSGYTSMDIAHLLGISIRTVAERLRVGRERLKEEMVSMMSATLKERSLPVGFTFKIVEMVKRIRIHPITQTKGLPWGLSLATGVIITIFCLNPYMPWFSQMDTPAGATLPGETKVLKTGEISVDILKTSEITVISSKMGKGKGGETKQLDVQNDFSMAPQAEGGKWAKKVDMPTARNMFSTSMVDGKIYAIGGRWSLPIVEEYDPETDTWTRKSNMPTGRQALSTIAVDGIIYAIGGYNDNSVRSTVEAYNPETDTWKERKDMPTPRQLLSTSVVNGKIYAIGGMVGLTVYTLVEVYDPAEDTWAKSSDNMPTARWGLSTSVVNGEIYAIGGCPIGAQPFNAISTVEAYNPVIDKWMKKADMPEARAWHSACVVNNRIYIVGGGKDWLADETITYFSTVYEYNPKTDTWTKKTDMPTARWWLSTSEVGERIYAIGGSTVNYNMVLSTMEEYTPEGWPFQQSVFPRGKLPKTWGKLKGR